MDNSSNDMKSDFLNEWINEVHMKEAFGFSTTKEILVCNLGKGLYGLKQVPRAWYLGINEHIDLGLGKVIQS